MVWCRYSPATAVIPKMGEQGHHTGVGDRVAGRLGLGQVRSARDFTGDADDDQHRSGGQQQPRATDGVQFVELVGDEEGGLQVAEVVQGAGEPQPTLLMITTWSTVWATSLSTWLETRMVRPSSARWRSSPRSHAMPAGSSPLAGSSSSSTGGSPSRAPARPRRWRMPRE